MVCVHKTLYVICHVHNGVYKNSLGVEMHPELKIPCIPLGTVVVGGLY